MKFSQSRFRLLVVGITTLSILGGGAFILSRANQARNSDTQTQIAISSQPSSDPDVSGRHANTQPREAEGSDGSKETVNGSLITTSHPDIVQKIAEEKKLTIIRSTTLPNGKTLITLKEPATHSAVRSLGDKAVDVKVGHNYIYRATYTFSDPDQYYANQWNLAKITASNAWDINTGSSAVTIAVLDTGVLFEQSFGDPVVTYSQPDFPTSRQWQNTDEIGLTVSEGSAPNCTSRGLVLDKNCNNLDDDGNGKLDDWRGWDFMGGFNGNASCPNYRVGAPSNVYVGEDGDPQPYSCDSPYYPTELNKTHHNGTCAFGVSACYVGHGTMVGSVAAATSNNGELIAGIDHQAQIMNLRVLDGYGYTTTSTVTAAVAYATAQGADVINMSLAVNDCSTGFVDTTLENAMTTAKAAGITIVAASGNANLSNVCYPASSSNAIAVGATDQNDARAGFSSYGNTLDVVAPGVNIPVANAPSSRINSLYFSGASGTSLAAPHVAGLAGLLKSQLPDASESDIYRLITEGTEITAGMKGQNRNDQYGYGRINLYKALRSTTITHPDGTLVKNRDTGQIYLIEQQQKRYVPSAAVYRSHYGAFDNRIKVATISDLALPDGLSLGWREGIIVKGSNHAVYVIDIEDTTTSKRYISSSAVFNNLGYTADDIIQLSDQQLPAQNGPPLTTSGRHPDGTIVVNSTTGMVYFVESSTKRYISNMTTLKSLYKGHYVLKSATTGDMNLTAGLDVGFAEGTVLKNLEGAIYIVDVTSGQLYKRYVSSMLVFNLLGFAVTDILSSSQAALPPLNGDPIN